MIPIVAACLFFAASATVIKGGGYFPVAVRLRSGEVMVVLREGAAHLGRGGRLSIVRSRDEGRTWTAPVTVADGPEDDRNPALGQLRDGAVLLGYAVLSGYDPSGGRFPSGRMFDGVYLKRLRGAAWTDAERSPAIHAFYAGKGAVSPFGKIVQTRDGTVLMAVYFAFDGERGHESWLFRSRDGGRTWGDPSLIGRRHNETALVETRGGGLVAAMRSEKGAHLAVVRSADGGRTWSEPGVITRDGEHPADLLALRDGRLVLSHGVRNAPRGVAARVSRDGGRTWGPARVLADDAPNTDCGYPSSVDLGGGRVLTVYYQVGDLKNAPASAKLKAVVWNAAGNGGRAGPKL